MSHFFQTCLIAMLVAFLGACALPFQGDPMPSMTFAHVEPVAIDVQMVQLQQNDALYDQDFFMRPSDAVQSYLDKRFTAQGGTGALHAVIEEASVTKGYTASLKKSERYFNIGGTDQYKVVIRLTLEHEDQYGQKPYGSKLTVQRTINISEHASIVERERRQLVGLEALFKELDEQVLRVVLRDMKLGSTLPEMRREQNQNWK